MIPDVGRGLSSDRRSRTALLLARLCAVPLLALVALAVACGGGGQGSPTPTATELVTPTPTLSIKTPGPTSQPPATNYRLLYREFTPNEDVIWSALPSDPTQREEVVRIPHREGYGIKPSLSPDGKLLAYLSLPEDAISAQSSQAQAFVMDLASKETVMVGGGMDMGYKPMWSPDSKLLYLRQYAGPEFLSADVIILRIFVTPPSTETPTPSPTPAPDQTPAPTPTQMETVMRDSVARVLAFAPIGFADDDKSMLFIQVQGGTGGGTLVGIYSPATSDAVESVQQLAEAAQKAADEENKRLADEAAANGQPPPDPTVSPAPTPAPDVRLVVNLSDQVAFDYSLSPDMHSVAYLVQEFKDTGEILNQAYIADLIEADTKAFPGLGLAVGNHLRPLWYPDGRLTIGVLPEDGGEGQLALVSLDGSNVLLLPQAEGGFDQPRSWSPDGAWLAVAHSSGDSLANPGPGRLDLVSINGQRVKVIDGVDNMSEDSVLGWIDTTVPTDTPSS